MKTKLTNLNLYISKIKFSICVPNAYWIVNYTFTFRDKIMYYLNYFVFWIYAVHSHIYEIVFHPYLYILCKMKWNIVILQIWSILQLNIIKGLIFNFDFKFFGKDVLILRYAFQGKVKKCSPEDQEKTERKKEYMRQYMRQRWLQNPKGVNNFIIRAFHIFNNAVQNCLIK